MGVNTLPAVQEYSRLATITTSQTWVHPDNPSATNPKKIKVVIVGGGAGGASGCSSNNVNPFYSTFGYYMAGGGSGYANLQYLTMRTASAVIVIGAGGTGGAATTNNVSTGAVNGVAGANGGQSSFNQFIASGGFATGTGGSSSIGNGGQGGIFGAPHGNPLPFIVSAITFASQLLVSSNANEKWVPTEVSQWIAGAGGGGGNSVGAGRVGGSSAYGIGNGGDGGTTVVNSAGGTSGAGGNATGYGAGGGSSGNMGTDANNTNVTNSPKGGDGSQGVVYIFY